MPNPPSPVAFFSHPRCQLHEMGSEHPESPERLAAIEAAVKANIESDLLIYLKPKPADPALLALAHDDKYLEWLHQQSPQTGSRQLDGDTSINPFSLRAASLAVGAVTEAIDGVMAGAFKAAFCATRPPGHHAESDKAMEFCLYNQIAIGAKYALEHHDLERVAIVDFDVHHGNGTQEIVAADKRILYCSSFQHPLYPYSGIEPASDNIINTPLAAGADGTVFRQVVNDVWLPALQDFNPELFLISAGFDAHKDDPLAQLNFVEADYYQVTVALKQLADEICLGRIVSTLEGGYQRDALAASVCAHIKGLQGCPL